LYKKILDFIEKNSAYYNQVVLAFKMEKQKLKDFENTICMWKLESEYHYKGGIIKDGDFIRLKNLKTGMYLLIKPINFLNISSDS
jgi:hypothetical protein